MREVAAINDYASAEQMLIGPYEDREPMQDFPGNTVDVLSKLEGGLHINGTGNEIKIDEGSTIGASIHINGSNNRIYIGKKCIIRQSIIMISRADHCQLYIGDETTMEGHASLQLHERANIMIGRDCMFSTHVFVTVSDMHAIYDRATGQRVNNPRSVEIGDHVWVGHRAIVCKGTKIGSGSVIGAGSVVARAIPENVIAAGAPARVLREDIEWDRDRYGRIPR